MVDILNYLLGIVAVVVAIGAFLGLYGLIGGWLFDIDGHERPPYS